MSEAIKVTLAELASALSGQTMTANEEHTFLVSRDLLLTLVSPAVSAARFPLRP